MSDGGDRAAVKPRERDSIIQALRAGVVPRVGLRHVQVGRAREVEQVVADVERVAAGGAAIRVVVGDYGSGKTFFLNLVRSVALQRSLVSVHADLSPDRRVHSSGGHARALYAELMRNMATRSKPEGGALANVVERFLGDAKAAAAAAGIPVEAAIRDRLSPVQELVSGYDFATVVSLYCRGFDGGDETLKSCALRWLRGEYSLKTEARDALGVRSIIDDATAYDYIKVMAVFCKMAGYGGFLVVLDEMVNLFKLVNAQARNANYEQVLRIVNDVLQGTAGPMMFYMGGTPEFLADPRRGLYSYEALRSRLAENAFARNGLVDLSGPVIRLQNLTPEELYILLGNLRSVFSDGGGHGPPLPDGALVAFMAHCDAKVGASYFRTPRNTIKAFLDLLAVMEQNPGTGWENLVGQVDVAPDAGPAAGDIHDEPAPPAPARTDAVAPPSGRMDDLASFRV